MLILSRKREQAIMIGDDIMIHVKDIRGGSRVAIGIEAPVGTKIARVDDPKKELQATTSKAQ